jgi:hypothetical protein
LRGEFVLLEDEEDAGKGALNEKVDAEGGLHVVVSDVFSMTERRLL